jgi:hypothetical protein
MRDPGRPGRNPFFDLGAYGRDELGRDDPPLGGDPGSDDLGFDDSGFGHVAAGPGPGSFTDHRGGAAGAPSLVDGLFCALAEASPEAAEHLVTAAHEMVLAVKVIVDAAESALAEHRRALGDGRRGGSEVRLRPVGGE